MFKRKKQRMLQRGDIVTLNDCIIQKLHQKQYYGDRSIVSLANDQGYNVASSSLIGRVNNYVNCIRENRVRTYSLTPSDVEYYKIIGTCPFNNNNYLVKGILCLRDDYRLNFSINALKKPYTVSVPKNSFSLSGISQYNNSLLNRNSVCINRLKALTKMHDDW